MPTLSSTVPDPTPEPGPIVETPSGAVRGTWGTMTERGGRIAVFQGIPYAEPPVGALRFAAPIARAPWTEIRDATRFGPTPQREETGITLIPEHAVPGDDTLSVNVWTPNLAPARLAPVVVWIHGGGFVSGSPASPWYDGSTFARDGTVFVSLSYRIGFVGFGALDPGSFEPSATDPAPRIVQNRGVHDWIRALEWVRDHITAFGGDPGRVTIAGQSAGGAAALTLLGAPAARGLFHGAYAVSPAVADPDFDAALDRSRRLAHLAGVPPTYAGFSSLSEERMLEIQSRITSPAPPRLLRGIHTLLHRGLMIGPVLDGETVLDVPGAAAAAGVQAHVPLVLGATAHELSGLFHPGGLLDHAPTHATLRVLGATREQAHTWLAAQQNDTAHPGDTDQHADTHHAAILGQFATDSVFRRHIPAIAAARTSAAAGPTWVYSFDWAAHSANRISAGHCSDVPFLFDCLNAPGVDRVAGATPPQELADAIHGALVAFSKRGDPGWEPALQADTLTTRIFDVPVRDVSTSYAAAALLN